MVTFFRKRCVCTIKQYVTVNLMFLPRDIDHISMQGLYTSDGLLNTALSANGVRGEGRMESSWRGINTGLISTNFSQIYLVCIGKAVIICRIIQNPVRSLGS
jgi:hypothetical protein